MQFAPIPIYGNDYDQLRFQAGLSQFQMSLAHLVLKDNMYRRYYRKLSDNGGYVVLDNSIIELGNAMDFDQVLSAAGMVRADEVILPDVLFDSYKTIDLVTEALKNKNAKPYKKMAVVQGKDYNEICFCIKQYLEIDEIDVLGIPKAWAKLVDENSRHILLNKLFHNGILNYITQVKGKEIHLLGANDYSDFNNSYHGLIRSIDSVYPSWMALHGIKFLPEWHANKLDRPEGKVEHKTERMTHLDMAIYNIGVTLGWTHNA